MITFVCWLVGWLVGFKAMSILVLFYTEVSLTIMVSNYIYYKNASSQHFQSNGQRNRSTQVRTLVALLRLLSDKYPWERHEPPDPPAMG